MEQHSDKLGNLKIFITAAGGYIACQEIERKDGKRSRIIRHPGLTQIRSDSTGYDFKPLTLVSRDMEIFEGSLMGEIDLPHAAVDFYLKYYNEREDSFSKLP